MATAEIAVLATFPALVMPLVTTVPATCATCESALVTAGFWARAAAAPSAA
ncbi:hypothetical protein [Nocardia seriolae]|uniref:hypothetical protein n=1 Tax=Nocardia seriolae TaxID=37332 RepID=UPI0012BBE838|nr:hypothetical protein [Nocardia seriolae]MTJ60092.1 hypothetical protein [Nocardia seriolae]MTJ76344.1 hypothetical protein [Nocardia seriolae]MTJ85093.1 hypothetical protein [Nocardia seriolae]MTK38021.1 hypothetical protein [Nocardia seriolae]QOW32279.1 hypothetical protein IMZ23_30490 [Nocardia seriolae]